MGSTAFPHGRFLSFSVLWCIAVLTWGPVMAESEVPPLPDSVQRSLIIGIDAGPVDKDSARKKGREMALKKARTFLADWEKAGLSCALVPTPPQGPISILAQKKIPGKQGKPSGFWIETEAAFTVKDPKTAGPPNIALLDRADLLDVRIWTERREYREREPITLTLQGNRDFYAKIAWIDAAGKVRQLLPNNYRQIAVFEKGRRYRLPDEGDRYRLEVRPPFGVVRFVVYAARLPMSHVNLKTIGGGIYEYRSGRNAFGRSVRRIIPEGEEGLTPFCEAGWEIRTRPR